MSDGPGSLPTHWETTRVDRVATVNARIGWKALTAAEYQSEGYAFLATPNIKGKEIDFDNVKYISELRYRESPELQIREGDVLLTKDGFTLGTVNVVRKVPKPATVNGSIAVLRSQGIDSRFLCYVIASSATQGYMWAAKNGMDVLHLFQRDIKKIPIPLPPDDEQHRIADFLDAETTRIDNMVSITHRLRSTLYERKEVQRSLLLRGAYKIGIRAKHPMLGDIPDSWDVLPLKRLVPRIGVGVVVDPSSYFSEQGLPFLRGSNITEGGIDLHDARFISEEDSKKLWRSRLSVGDVVVIRAGYPGRAAVVPVEFEGSNCASILIIKKGNRLIPKYLEAYFNSPLGKAYVDSVRYGAAQEQINVSHVVDFMCPAPSLDEQEQIVTQLESLEAPIAALRQKLSSQARLLAERRQALITAAVTGQFDVSTASGRNVTEGVSA